MTHVCAVPSPVERYDYPDPGAHRYTQVIPTGTVWRCVCRRRWVLGPGKYTWLCWYRLRVHHRLVRWLFGEHSPSNIPGRGEPPTTPPPPGSGGRITVPEAFYRQGHRITRGGRVPEGSPPPPPRTKDRPPPLPPRSIP